MIKTYEITVDIEKELYSPSSLLFSVSNNDLETIELIIQIKQDNANMNLEGTTVELAIKKPSGLTVYQETEMVDVAAGSIRVRLKNQAYLEGGVHTAELYVRNETQLAVTCPFYYYSREAIMKDLEVESVNDWSALQQALFAYDLKPLLVEGFPTETPEYIGQLAFDYLNKRTYIATDLTAVSWAGMGSGEGGAGGNDDVLGTGAPAAIPARIGQLYINITDRSAYIATGSTAADWEQIDNTGAASLVSWEMVTDKPEVFPADLNDPGLTAALAAKADDSDLAAKADLNHTHGIDNIEGLRSELDSKLEAIPAEYLTEAEGDLRYLTGIPAEYLTEAEAAGIYQPKGNYLTAIPAEYLTEAEAGAAYQPKGNYLTAIPAEYLTEAEGDLRYEAKGTEAPAPAWGEITGDLTNQADLNAALAAKADDSDLAAKADVDHTHEIADVGGLTEALAAKAAEDHTHEILDIAGLQTALDSKMDDTEKAALLTEAEGDLRYKAITAPVDPHVHPISEVTGLQAALDNKADDVDLEGYASYDFVYVKDEVYNKTEIDQMTMGDGGGSPVIVEDNLASTSTTNALSANQGRILNSTKASLNHTHTVSQLTDFAAGVAANIPAEYLTAAEGTATFAPAAHGHTTAEITDFAAGVAANIPAEYITSTEAEGTYLKAVPAEYLTEAEAAAVYQPKGNYLTAIPAEYLTEAEAAGIYQPKGTYLTAVPAEYLTEAEGDLRYEPAGSYAPADHNHTTAEITDFAAGVAANIPAEYLTEAEAGAAYQPKGTYLTAVPAEYLTEAEAAGIYQPKGTYLTAVPLMGGANIGGAMVGNGLAMAGNYLLVKRGAGIGLAPDNSITVDSLNGKKLWTGSQADYDLITTPDPSTLYFITG